MSPSWVSKGLFGRYTGYAYASQCVYFLFCCRQRAVIEFRNLDYLDRILFTYRLTSEVEPRRLCQVSPSVLFFNCVSSTHSEIRWLKCSTPPPKENTQKTIVVGQKMYWDICFAEEQNKNIVIVTSEGPEGTHAYNADTKLLEWQKEIDGMEKVGIAADGHGRLFVFDKENKCIHVLSVADGLYIGCLIREGEQDLGRPCWGVGLRSCRLLLWSMPRATSALSVSSKLSHVEHYLH